MNATQIEILERLGAAAGTAVSGEELGHALGISRAAVAKAVADSRELGYVIESSPRLGHRLVSCPDLLLPPEVRRGLSTKAYGRVVHHFPEVPSTQVVARALAVDGTEGGALVVAEVQNAGRGRRGRSYECPKGGIWCTLIIREEIPPSVAPLVSLAAGLAVMDAIRSVARLPASLKWPNDVLVNGRKVAGTLTEMAAEDQVVQYLLVGTGINANFAPEDLSPELRGTATTLLAEAGVTVDRARLLRAYLEEMERLCGRLARGDAAAVLGAWRRAPNSIGHRVVATTFTGTLEGRAVGLDDRGALVVMTDGGHEQVLTAADVVHVSPKGPVRSVAP